MDARIAVLEEIAAATKDGIAGLRQETRDANGRIDAVGGRIDALRNGMNHQFDATRNDMNQRFDATRDDMNHRFDATRNNTDRRFDAMRDDMNRRFDALRSAQERDFRIMFSALITTTLGLAALMAKGFHWF
ncbi:MAG TPA: hypothetical protein VGG99_27360 [Acetobacteraceae bacterium]|jgi:hypothetical protein